MHRFGMADPAELAIFTKAVDDCCAKYGVSEGDNRDDIAVEILRLFQQGIIDPAELAGDLDRFADMITRSAKRRASYTGGEPPASQPPSSRSAQGL